jgi:hypothetical protein
VRADDEDGPYAVAAGHVLYCPGCHKPLPDDAVLCVECGLDLQTGAKLEREYQPLDFYWESGLSLRARVRLYCFCQGLALLLAIVGTIAEWDIWEFPLWAWLFSAVLLALVLGSFQAVAFSRNRRGQVRMVKTWRIAFVRRRPESILVEGYEGVTVSTEYQSGVLEWLIAIILLGYGVFPGILWWYHVIHRNLYCVSLCRDHGFPEQWVYRGKDEPRAKEIAEVLRGAFHR